VLPPRVRRYDGFFLHHRFPRFRSSGCFFTAGTQICYFEPFLPLFGVYGGLGYFDSGFDFEDSWTGWGDGSQTSAAEAATGFYPADNSSQEPGAAQSAPAVVPEEDRGLATGVFVLVLTNGTTQRVTDYWAADGYLEYVSLDGTRSHIPLDALDLQGTVLRNAPRGLAFVLRSAPGQNR
jgi:hypothetical protein